MLKSISVRNFAIIESVEVEWTSGLNVLTGETGAGKSILFDALSIVLGAKAGATHIRAGANSASIEACFSASPEVTAWLKTNELIDQDQLDLIVSREITKTGSRSRINGSPVNHSILQELRGLLLTFHAQHEIRTLLIGASQLALLDGLGDKSHSDLLSSYRTKYACHQDLLQQLSEMEMSESERIRNLEFNRFQLKELENAKLEDPGEDEELKERKDLLEHAVQLETAAGNLARLLCGEQEGFDTSFRSAIDLLQEGLAELETASLLDNRLAEPVELLRTSLANAEETATALRAYRNRIDSDPETLNYLEERQNILCQIKRKFGPTLSDAIEKQKVLINTIESLENADWQAEKIKSEIVELKENLLRQAKKISQGRKGLSTSLSKSIIDELAQLGMEKADFSIAITHFLDPGPQGLDKVEFLIAANPGQPLMPLSKIASGGELSRIMLALKTIFARADSVSTIVFDEIDTGMSGKTVTAIRDKLARLATTQQILCITHNPIVASVADNHIDVCKEQSNDKTIISVRRLNPQERDQSLAAMASGHPDEEVSLSFARSLMQQATSLKSSLK
ncbi:MAG: DNA repair protein RecN [Candidatus Obscuribacterales bacterium]|nr:DNA repair protein RecN [Candidatus Obscuribacterales bacterium]